ncbi:sugar ABC transporter substrate-binding protein [Caldicellulosiruptor naganoensis]|uniref:Substrate-binding domain-containing protein n=1 Tax=Caldicellulosiruptor naganoensis TaxID=29324 RepID=A0ABY7BHH2_9FIRM|nr:substrate-binding domain-containing protein [Caldicellulosiruptor naganoensis]WAM31496.1 substrate-binding domain-containing protein [Caldicellulosiruptor naganoensis]
MKILSRDKRLIFVILIVLLIVVSIGVIWVLARHVYSYKSKKQQRPPIKIGFAMSTLKEERWFFDRKYLIDAAKKKGFEVEWTNANENDSTQFQQVKYLLTKDIDVLIIVPSSFDGAKKSIELAKQKNIPVICYDRIAMNADIDAYVSFDNVEVGRIMAKHLLKKVSQGNYVFILGNPKDYNTFLIRQGYKSVLDPYIQKGKIHILLEDYCYKWKKEYAYEYIAKLLQAGKKIDAILAENDSLAEGAISALAEKKLAGKIPVVGQDAELPACKRVVSGLQSMTVYKPVKRLADLTVKIVEQLVKNGTLPYTKTYFNNGYKMVPAYYIKPIEVTRENIIATIVKDKYHTYEEIFK